MKSVKTLYANQHGRAPMQTGLIKEWTMDIGSGSKERFNSDKQLQQQKEQSTTGDDTRQVSERAAAELPSTRLPAWFHDIMGTYLVLSWPQTMSHVPICMWCGRVSHPFGETSGLLTDYLVFRCKKKSRFYCEISE